MNELRGAVVAAVTPLGRDQSVDLGALRALVDYYVDNRAHGLFVLASQGEFFSLDPRERRQVTRAAVRAARGRIPVVVNTGAVSTRTSLRLSEEAEGEGVDAIGLITPYYLKPSPQELLEHYRTILRGVRCPVYAYNNPARAGGVGLAPATVTRLAETSDRFAGIFDGVGDLRNGRRYSRLQGGRFAYFLAGHLDVTSAIRAGARGGVSAMANAAPREFAAMFEAASRGDLAEAECLRKRLEPLDALFRTGPFPGLMKACLELLGLRVGPPRLPALPASPVIRAKAKVVLARLEGLRHASRGGGS